MLLSGIAIERGQNMFGTLFLKECKQIAKSMVYYIYVVVFVLFLTSQFSSGLKLETVPRNMISPWLSTAIFSLKICGILVEQCNKIRQMVGYLPQDSEILR